MLTGRALFIMADKAKSILDTLAGYFQPAQPEPKKLTKNYVQKNKQDIAKTFATKEENDYNTKARKALGLE
jgi:hypothetical protein